MKSDRSVQYIIAMVVVIAGAIIGPAFLSPIASGILMMLAGIVAIAFVSLRNTNTAPPASLLLKRLEDKNSGDIKMDAYLDMAAALTDPVLLVKDALVIAANLPAQNLLGNHIIGEDVRIAIRHPAASDRLASTQTEHSGEPTLLVGVGSAGQRWELRIHKLGDSLKLLTLSDQTSYYTAERMRTDFVANASHELRTPIAAIKGFVETLENPDAGRDEATRSRFLKIMHNEANHMQQLVEDLMSLSRIEAEKYQLPTTPVDLPQVVAEVRDFYISSRGKTLKDFVITQIGDVPMVRGDRSQLSQLIHNLVSNAYKYGRDGGPVTVIVTLNDSGSMLGLSVQDEGTGIAAHHLPRLTERFYRVDKGRSKVLGGTGLGLAIVKHITQRHGGRMEISSILGKGTKVSVLLPIIAAN